MQCRGTTARKARLGPGKRFQDPSSRCYRNSEDEERTVEKFGTHVTLSGKNPKGTSDSVSSLAGNEWTPLTGDDRVSYNRYRSSEKTTELIQKELHTRWNGREPRGW
jgi:hypothetical protein